MAHTLIHSFIRTGIQLEKGWSWPNFWANLAFFSLATLIEQGDLSLVGYVLTMEDVWCY